MRHLSGSRQVLSDVKEGCYELIAERYQSDKAYAIFVFHDRYDVPVKAADKYKKAGIEKMLLAGGKWE